MFQKQQTKVDISERNSTVFTTVISIQLIPDVQRQPDCEIVNALFLANVELIFKSWPQPEATSSCIIWQISYIILMICNNSNLSDANGIKVFCLMGVARKSERRG